MKTFTTIATLSALLGASYAAKVTLEETPCLQPNTELRTFTIDTDKLVVQQLDSVCGLKITKAEGADINAISCQAYKDAEGKSLGSARFTFAQPALIATNPVQEGSIRCDTTGANNTASATMSMVAGSAASSGTAAPKPSGGAPGGGNSTGPSATQTPPAPPSSSPTSPSQGGAGSRTSMSAAAIAAAFGIFML